MPNTPAISPVFSAFVGVTAIDHHTDTFVMFLTSPSAVCVTFWAEAPIGSVLDMPHHGPCILVAKQETKVLDVITRIYVELKPITENKEAP